MELEPQILDRQGCPIHYWLGGPPSAPLVVLTHGACVDHRSWRLLAPVVAEKYRTLTWDVRGHGLSQPVGQPFTTPLAVEDLLALMDQLGYPKAVLVGHSNGTYISQELVYRHPERVTALVIADGTCITWHHNPFERWLINASGDFMKLLPFETLKTAGLPYFSANKEVQQYTYEAFSMLTKPAYISLWNGVSSCLHEDPAYRIPVPVLLVHGANDATGDIRKIAPAWAAQILTCQYEVIPNASHFAILDNPEVVNRLVMDFLYKWAPV
jgi:3-oxoadipate enol-lactonase